MGKMGIKQPLLGPSISIGNSYSFPVSKTFHPV